MAFNDYRFATRWQLAGTISEIMDVLRDAESVARWCPVVYRKARTVVTGNRYGIGTVVELTASSKAGYTLRFQLRVTEISEDSCAFTVSGDVTGVGTFHFIPCHAEITKTDMIVHWHVRAEKPFLRYTSALLRPFFVSNHNWAMSQGMRCLDQELARRRSA